MVRTLIRKITTVGDGMGIYFPKWTAEADGFRKGQTVRVTIEPYNNNAYIFTLVRILQEKAPCGEVRK